MRSKSTQILRIRNHTKEPEMKAALARLPLCVCVK